MRILGTPKFIEKTGEHIRIKKARCPKDRDVFDFMPRPPHDNSPVVDSPILEVMARPKNYENDAGTIGSEVEYIERLLKYWLISKGLMFYIRHLNLQIFSL